ncbi:hypothetical protein [Sedimenticola thiotaurini]|uniref:hypothetical protein n=1 Tax=Sedimenticola thiotaurini TaxID=1543721 RepID=UPI00069BF340|nr:hypothetical protein [Sedimenticola thiotaurini]
MSDQSIKPEKITKPIQLLGAWLAGLFSIDSCFLFAVANLNQGSLESYALTIAAIVNVPIFLIAVFLLQTKFRPELQEDSYYSTYLNQKTNEKVVVSKTDAHIAELSSIIAGLKAKIEKTDDQGLQENNVIKHLNIGINSALPDLEEVKLKLKEAGATSYSLFGNGDMPTNRVLAMSPRLSDKAQHELIGFAQQIGFTHFSYYEPGGDEDIEEDALLGGYGDPGRAIL